MPGTKTIMPSWIVSHAPACQAKMCLYRARPKLSAFVKLAFCPWSVAPRGVDDHGDQQRSQENLHGNHDTPPSQHQADELRLVGAQLSSQCLRCQHLGHADVQQTHDEARDQCERQHDVEVSEEGLGGPDGDREGGLLVLGHSPV